FPELSSACWRGYVGHWMVEGRRLYLEKLVDDDGEIQWRYPLSRVFAGHTAKRAFAHWFTASMLLLDKIDPQAFEGCDGLKRPALTLDVKLGHLIAERVVDRPDVDMLDPWTSLTSSSAT